MVTQRYRPFCIWDNYFPVNSTCAINLSMGQYSSRALNKFQILNECHSRCQLRQLNMLLSLLYYSFAPTGDYGTASSMLIIEIQECLKINCPNETATQSPNVSTLAYKKMHRVLLFSRIEIMELKAMKETLYVTTLLQLLFGQSLGIDDFCYHNCYTQCRQKTSSHLECKILCSISCLGRNSSSKTHNDRKTNCMISSCLRLNPRERC